MGIGTRVLPPSSIGPLNAPPVFNSLVSFRYILRVLFSNGIDLLFIMLICPPSSLLYPPPLRVGLKLVDCPATVLVFMDMFIIIIIGMLRKYCNDK